MIHKTRLVRKTVTARNTTPMSSLWSFQSMPSYHPDQRKESPRHPQPYTTSQTRSHTSASPYDGTPPASSPRDIRRCHIKNGHEVIEISGKGEIVFRRPPCTKAAPSERSELRDSEVIEIRGKGEFIATLRAERRYWNSPTRPNSLSVDAFALRLTRNLTGSTSGDELGRPRQALKKSDHSLKKSGGCP
jgi:hypothetical protein